MAVGVSLPRSLAGTYVSVVRASSMFFAVVFPSSVVFKFWPSSCRCFIFTLHVQARRFLICFNIFTFSEATGREVEFVILCSEGAVASILGGGSCSMRWWNWETSFVFFPLPDAPASSPRCVMCSAGRALTVRFQTDSVLERKWIILVGSSKNRQQILFQFFVF